MRGFTTPPYTVIIFAFAELLVLLTDLLESQFQVDILLGLFHFTHIILLGGFIWSVGKLPLKTSRPAHNVARPGDVC